MSPEQSFYYDEKTIYKFPAIYLQNNQDTFLPQAQPLKLLTPVFGNVELQIPGGINSNNVATEIIFDFKTHLQGNNTNGDTFPFQVELLAYGILPLGMGGTTGIVQIDGVDIPRTLTPTNKSLYYNDRKNTITVTGFEAYSIPNLSDLLTTPIWTMPALPTPADWQNIGLLNISVILYGT